MPEDLPVFERYMVDVNIGRILARLPDVVVVGSGVAALSAALTAAEDGCQVIVITKEQAQETNTFYAQGGVACVFDETDAPENHIADTLAAGAGLCKLEAVEKLIHDSQVRIKQLTERGVKFDLKDDGHYKLGREGGHSHFRILHANGDATGRAIQVGLQATAMAHPNIQILENHFAIDLITQGTQCFGVVAYHAQTEQLVTILARATVLASGGCGQIFRETTNPGVATGDGMAMAFRAGAVVQDMEFIQFHPTTLYLAGAPRFLITEAVRGEGAHLRNAKGERFMARYAPDQKELAPRDVVATASIQEMQRTGANCVYLDLSPISAARIRDRFPTILDVLSHYGIDITKDRIPVRPAAHYMMGGVQTDLTGQTSVRRLMAAGEVACTGVHGANRLASNSLLEGLVFGYEAGRAAIEWANLQFDDRQPRQLKRRFERNPFPIDVDDVRRSLQSVMWYDCGVFRDAENLVMATAKIDQWQKYVVVRDPSDLGGMELQNMLLVSRLMLEGAFRRKESRGAHRRTDWPNVNDERWKQSITFQRETFETVMTSQGAVPPPPLSSGVLPAVDGELPPAAPTNLADPAPAPAPGGKSDPAADTRGQPSSNL